VLPRGATVVLLTTAHNDPSLADAVEAVVASGGRCLLVAPAPESAEVASGQMRRRGDAVARLVRLERRRWLDALRLRGAHVVDWDVRDPLPEALARVEVGR
jgi:uncharacterized protein (DUF58 family)